MFCLGLILVVVGGAELFTGNNLIVMAWASGKVTGRALLRNWVIVYAGNFVGAFGIDGVDSAAPSPRPPPWLARPLPLIRWVYRPPLASHRAMMGSTTRTRKTRPPRKPPGRYRM